MTIKLHNSLTNSKETFEEIEDGKVGMYVCGPTVYNRPHLGNARSVVIYDVLYRLMRHEYGKDNVTYVRNITDVDDKINKAAKDNNETIGELTKRVTKQFHDDIGALNCLIPNYEPKATENIGNIIKLIENIIKNGGGYVSEGHVLFDVKAFNELTDNKDSENNYFYGKLSGKKLEDLVAGARIEVEKYKKNPEDFVLWKPANEHDDQSSKFDSPWGIGRPGWHIECSAMSTNILGEDFDIHGGGADLKFPHHENEIAQSTCANRGSKYAKYWVHNGFLTVNGEKMSKSLGNFTTVNELLEKGIPGEVIRLALLSAHYRKPLDFNDKLLEDSKKTLDKFYDAIKIYNKNNLDKSEKKVKNLEVQKAIEERNKETFSSFLSSLKDDMNYPLAISHLYTIAKGLRSYECSEYAKKFFDDAINILGVCQSSTEDWFDLKSDKDKILLDENYIEQKIKERQDAKKNKDFSTADSIRDELNSMGITLKDTNNSTEWNIE